MTPLPALNAIAAVVADFYGVRVLDLADQHRSRSISQPRQVFMYLARRLTLASVEAVGEFLGGRHHTTVLHGVGAVESRRARDNEFDLVVRSLEEAARGAATPGATP